jgi:transcriptional regulator with PAS, ATPase and Fis domain
MPLQRIEKNIQQIAEAIAEAIDAHVTIVDRDLVRVAGTGPYERLVREFIPHNSAYGKVLETKETILIENPGKDPHCNGCAVKNECRETFEICTPIIWQDEVIGVMGIFAFNEEQKKMMVLKKKHHLRFLQKMSELIASKYGEAVLFEEVIVKNKELSTVIHHVNQGVLCVDCSGRVNQINALAIQLLGLNIKEEQAMDLNLHQFWPSALILKALKEGREYFNREEHYAYNNYKKDLITTVRLIKKGERITGAVATLSDIEEMHKSSFRFREKFSNFTFEHIISRSPRMQDVIKRARVVAGSDSTVLIAGESGTGKELFARAIHNASRRADYPFVGINCSAIPEALLESELFGYEPGAFTGASKNGKLGKFELAHKGTLFLDEVGDMPLFLQAKLLRVLQERQVLKLGGTVPKDIDVRIIAATNKNLEELIRDKMFREDLYYRLNVIPLEIPPLRERPEDIPALIAHFLDYYNQKFGKKVRGFSEKAMQFIMAYSWPGNVRELENIVEYGINFAEGDTIHFSEIQRRFKAFTESSEHKSLKERVREFERETIASYLDRYGWHEEGKSKVAKMLDISRSSLYRKVYQ